MIADSGNRITAHFLCTRHVIFTNHRGGIRIGGDLGAPCVLYMHTVVLAMALFVDESLHRLSARLDTIKF